MRDGFDSLLLQAEKEYRKWHTRKGCVGGCVVKGQKKAVKCNIRPGNGRSPGIAKDIEKPGFGTKIGLILYRNPG